MLGFIDFRLIRGILGGYLFFVFGRWVRVSVYGGGGVSVFKFVV